MKYHVISISNAGHGAIFTNRKDAARYQAEHPESTCRVFDRLPSKIPARKDNTPPVTGPVNAPAQDLIPGKAITIYTDGACSGNPGPSGLGVVFVQDNSIIHEISEHLGHGTNNIAELTAIKRSLEHLLSKRLESSKTTLFTDSQYSIGILTKNWKAKANVELVDDIRGLVKKFENLTFKYIKGHAGDPGNERADRLAVQGIQG